MLGYDVARYKKQFESFGWSAMIVNGHNVNELIGAFAKARKSLKPFAIIAKTIKGKGVSFIEGKNGWHGKALNREELVKALEEIPEVKITRIEIAKPKNIIFKNYEIDKVILNSYKLGEEVSTREAYGKALVNIAEADERVLVFDAEVSNSTFSKYVKEACPEKFIECFIAEQNMIGMALGASVKGHKVFASTFSAFLTRAHDQLRMAAISRGNLSVCGSHSGVSIGEDGASQMGLEDISMFRSLPNSIIFYPSDAVSTEKLINLAYQLPGIKYIRTTRPKTKVIYRNNEEFMLGEFKAVKSSSFDSVVLVGSGITLHEALKAHAELEKQGVKTAVVDFYCVKPFNSKKFIDFAKKHGGKIVIAEDHYSEGGIGEMLSRELANSGVKIKHLSVSKIPHSGIMEELLNLYEIDSQAIVKSAQEIIK